MSKKKAEVWTTEVTQGPVLIRKCFLPAKGDVIPGHTHNYDHAMIFMRGKGKVISTHADGTVEEAIVEAPGECNVSKHVKHSVEALSDDVLFYCVFPHRDIKGNVTDQPDAREAYI